jgi:hypothetical protein
LQDHPLRTLFSMSTTGPAEKSHLRVPKSPKVRAGHIAYATPEKAETPLRRGRGSRAAEEGDVDLRTDEPRFQAEVLAELTSQENEA